MSVVFVLVALVILNWMSMTTAATVCLVLFLLEYLVNVAVALLKEKRH